MIAELSQMTKDQAVREFTSLIPDLAAAEKRRSDAENERNALKEKAQGYIAHIHALDPDTNQLGDVVDVQSDWELVTEDTAGLIQFLQQFQGIPGFDNLITISVNKTALKNMIQQNGILSSGKYVLPPIFAGMGVELHPTTKYRWRWQQLIAPASASEAREEVTEQAKGLFGDTLYLNLETTSYAGEPVQITLLDANGTPLLDTLVKNQEFQMDTRAMAAHGITPSHLKDERTFAEIGPEFLPMIAGKTVVGYNTTFIRLTLERTCEAYDLTMPEVNWVSAMNLYRNWRYGYSGKHDKLAFAAADQGIRDEGDTDTFISRVEMTRQLVRVMAGLPPVKVDEPDTPATTQSEGTAEDKTADKSSVKTSAKKPKKTKKTEPKEGHSTSPVNDIPF